MPGTMSETDLVADLKAALNDAATAFTAASDADFKRHLANAALDLGRLRRRTLVATLTLVADQRNYTAPAGLIWPKYPLWGVVEKARSNPWEKNWPGRLPRLHLVEDATTGRELHLDPPPTAAQIAALGTTYRYYYYAGHTVDADAAKTTVHTSARDMLLLRAAAEAMRELAYRNSKKPVQLRDGLGSAPRNSTPAALADWLMQEFERRAAA